MISLKYCHVAYISMKEMDTSHIIAIFHR
uniref:Uncharacterized protein n=1 Tax=Rhizophora mucronata TaxID=61149 RepID=A0A2P2NX87_RHIMU